MIDHIGDGQQSEVNLHMVKHVRTYQALIDFVFPSNTASDPTYCLTHTVLASTHEQVDLINDSIYQTLQGDSTTYHAADTLEERQVALDSTTNNDDNTEDHLPTPQAILDYVRRRTPSGMPHHRLHVKKGAVYRLLRNFSIDRGLVKNIRVVITGLGHKLITIQVLKHDNQLPSIDDQEILLPRITFKDTLPSGHTLLRRQFPLALAYATTFHSCQGLTLNKVGIDLSTPLFTHGQLYTALSRVRRRTDACVLIDQDNPITKNVTYTEILI
jgi:ATP-dependent DNA helicase PIF1